MSHHKSPRLITVGLEVPAYSVPRPRSIHTKECPRQEGRHLLAGNLVAGAVVVIAATLSDTQFDKALDVAAKKGAGGDILEGRDTTAVIQGRLARDGPDDEGGHLVTGDQTLGTIVTAAATAGDIQFGEALDVTAGPGIGGNVTEIG